MKPKAKKVLISVPEPLLKKLDAAARSQQRTRTAEVCLRLAKSLDRKSESAQA